MLRVGLRFQRSSVIGYTLLGAFLALLQVAGFERVAGTTAAERAAFASQMEVFGRQISYLLPLPVRVDTLGGFLQWRLYGIFPVVFAFWAVLAATSIARGEEERGLTDCWLSAGVSRLRLVVTGTAAFLGTAAAVLAVVALVTGAAAAAAGAGLGAGALAAQSAALLALTGCCFGIGLIGGQLMPARRSAAGLAGGILLVLFFLNSLARSSDALSSWSWISPFHYYDRTQALIPGGRFDLPATAALVGGLAAFASLAVAAFRARDAGAPLLRRRPADSRPHYLPSFNPLLRQPVPASLYEQRTSLVVWVAGSCLGALFIAQVTRSTVDLLQNIPALRFYLVQAGHGSPYQAYLGVFWFGVMQLVLAAFAIVQVARWASDDAEGRLEMMLSAPVRRWRIVLERALALTIGCTFLVAASSAVLGLAAAAHQLGVEAGRLAQASLLLLPFALSFGAAGAALSAYLPRVAVPVLSAVATAGYFLQQIGPLLQLPDWTLDLSVFRLYGNPLGTGVYWRGLEILMATGAAGFAAAMVAMQTREVGR